ncbi:hypothetical protein HML84_01375 [Alcanivorax sp. IO_7]|nr:hypothetical protein HML84_01375 [Alcanivorax sp. IO_7]
MQTPARWWRSRGWGGRALAILAALYVLYALVVFFLLPGWVRDQARERLTDLLGREVTLERVALNPFTLSVTAEGFSVADPDTGTLARFDRLYLNAELWSSLFHWRPWVGDLDLEGWTRGCAAMRTAPSTWTTSSPAWAARTRPPTSRRRRTRRPARRPSRWNTCA